MIVTQQVEEPVQNQPASLLRGRVTFPPRVAPGGLCRDHDVAQETLEFASSFPLSRATFLPRERKHVRRPRPSAIGGVQPRDLPVIHETNIEIPPAQPQHLSQPPGKSAQPGNVQGNLFLTVQDQFGCRPVKTACASRGSLSPQPGLRNLFARSRRSASGRILRKRG